MSRVIIEESELDVRRTRRLVCYLRNEPYIRTLTKNKMLRKLRDDLEKYAHYHFVSEEEEYHKIGKYDRGMFAGWSAEHRHEDPIMRAIAVEYGAFDY